MSCERYQPPIENKKDDELISERNTLFVCLSHAISDFAYEKFEEMIDECDKEIKRRNLQFDFNAGGLGIIKLSGENYRHIHTADHR